MSFNSQLLLSSLADQRFRVLVLKSNPVVALSMFLHWEKLCPTSFNLKNSLRISSFFIKPTIKIQQNTPNFNGGDICHWGIQGKCCTKEDNRRTKKRKRSKNHGNHHDHDYDMETKGTCTTSNHEVLPYRRLADTIFRIIYKKAWYNCFWW